MELTPITIQTFSQEELTARAVEIRDAIQAKSVTAEQVGQLFCDLITCCGDVNTAIKTFIEVNIPELQTDIDNRLAEADDAALACRSEVQRSQRTLNMVESYCDQMSNKNLSAPIRVDIIDAPTEITISNPVMRQIKADIFPKFGIGSVLFISDNRSVMVTPDGKLTPIAIGTSTIHAVASTNSAAYKTLRIEVVKPRLRIASTGALRLDNNGNIRLT